MRIMSFCLSVFLSFCLSVFLSFCLSVFMSLCLYVFLSFCLTAKGIQMRLLMNNETECPSSSKVPWDLWRLRIWQNRKKQKKYSSYFQPNNFQRIDATKLIFSQVPWVSCVFYFFLLLWLGFIFIAK